MTEMSFIAPPKGFTVTFALEPAHNALATLVVLSSGLSGRSEWADRIAAALSPEQLEVNRRVHDAAAAYLEGVSWPSFPAWVDDLASRDAYAMRDQELDRLLRKATKVLGEEAGDLPDREELLADRSAYVSLIERIYECTGCTMEPEVCEADHAMLQDARARQETMITHMRTMWDEYLAADWERNLPMLQESVTAFESIDYAGKSIEEIIRQVTDRELPQIREDLPEEVEELIFIPSAHIAPYILVADCTGTAARIVFGARIPEGATVRSPGLSRSELVMRLSTLADDTRLRILELVAHKGEQRAQDITAHLDLSQSSASRHLRQLSATGYLTERRCEGAKCYRLNHDRINDTFGALQRFLG